jgi:hypothetical protein
MTKVEGQDQHCIKESVTEPYPQRDESGQQNHNLFI